MTMVVSKTRSIHELLTLGVFEIPWYQRYYDWEKKHATRLLEDTWTAVQDGEPCYFLGSVMLTKRAGDTSGRIEIIDGQQRLITLSIILSVLGRYFSGDNICRGGVERDLVERRALRLLYDLKDNHSHQFSDASSGRFSSMLRIHAPEEYRLHYKNIVIGQELKEKTKLLDANKTIDQFFHEGRRTDSDLERYFHFITNCVEISCLTIPEEMNPNKIFETINSRGKPLAAIDLIRNYLYSYFNHSEEERQDVHRKIENMRRNVIDNNSRYAGRFDEYARCYFQCRYGFIHKEQLYEKVREKIEEDIFDDSGEDAEIQRARDLIDDLTDPICTEVYKSIAFPEEGALCQAFTRDAGELRSGRDLPVLLHELARYKKVTFPVLFALLFHYCRLPQSDSQKHRVAVRHLRKMIIQFNAYVMRVSFIVAKFETSRFEEPFSRLASKIFRSRNTRSLNMMAFLKKFESEHSDYQVINDAQFISRMKWVTEKNSNKIKLFLSAIAGAQDLELHPQPHFQKELTLEHILPRSERFHAGWPRFGNAHQEYVDRYGNMTLLAGPHNTAGDYNRSFSNKKETFRSNPISLNRDLSRKHDWGPANINERQEKLAKMATQVWRFPK
ncbi:MAG: DUF262 domain-containing protein [Gammaproteobacteria bacterium AqS3]|nr:DUF262 domain-containing protein [Gammaproteobacteria bacterium AqS3]